MRNILAVAGKELRHYFHSPIAYLVLALWGFAWGFLFYVMAGSYVAASFRMQAMGGMGGPSMSINEYVIRSLLEGVLMVVVLFLIPFITMRLYAEEQRSGTIELLLTSPLTDLQIVFGKYLGALGLYAALVLLSFLYLGLLFIYGNPNAKPLLANALGLLLYGATLLALGMWISTFTKNQIIAGGASMIIFLLLYILNWAEGVSHTTVVQVLTYMALSTHLDNFAKGVIDLADVAYFATGSALGIFLTLRSVEALKGRP